MAVLHNDVPPFYRQLDLPLGAGLTDNGRAFCGTGRHPREPCLDLNGIGQCRTRVRALRTNGFEKRLNGTVLDASFRIAMRDRSCETVGAPQADLVAWFVHYNTERPHPGHRTMGRRPVEAATSFVSQEGQVDALRASPGLTESGAGALLSTDTNGRPPDRVVGRWS